MKRCKSCGTTFTLADQLRGVWGFQCWNGHPELPTLAYYQCDCETTFALELPNPTIVETSHAAIA